MSRAEKIRDLYRRRPRSLLVRGTVAGALLLVVYAWVCGEVDPGDLFQERRWQNLERFVGEEVRPFPLRDRDWDWQIFGEWFGALMADRGIPGMLATFAISVAAIVLAAAIALPFVPLASRNLARPEPFLPLGQQEARRSWLRWRAVSSLTRLWLILLRALPEYIWAFLLLALLGANAWPALLALAIHNGGILGKLGAECVENQDPKSLRQLRNLGGKRSQILLFGVLPLSFSCWLLYFFYRFETCIREATVLGMLGVVSLGYWIEDTRGKHYYDEMVVLIGLGVLLVVLADLASALARRKIRQAS